MDLRLSHGLPVISVTVEHQGSALQHDNVLVDTGSAGTVLKASTMARLGITRRPDDPIFTIRGVGGTEEVIIRTLDCVSIGDMSVDGFPFEIGAMDYGFPIDGILGMDFLTQVRAVIDLGAMELRADEE